LIQNGIYKMWYEGYRPAPYPRIGICYATSADQGLTWTKHGTVLEVTDDWEQGGLPSLSWQVGSPSVIYDNDIEMYQMWYYATRGSLGYATSTDGINWGNKTQQLGSGYYGNPEVVKGPSDYKLYYNKPGMAIYVMESSDGGVSDPWQVANQDNPVLSPGPPGQWDSATVSSPEVRFDPQAQQFQMWYCGNTADQIERIGYAVSADGLLWEKDPCSPVLEPVPGTWERDGVTPGSVVFDSSDSMYRMFYGGYKFDHWAIGLAAAVCEPKQVAIDIKPGSCPNPLNLKSKGKLPVAVLGSEDFDVNDIDPASIRLKYGDAEGVAAIRSNLEDVASPVVEPGLIAYWPFNGDATDASGNEHDGTVHGATLCDDRCLVPESAYCFDGENDYIEVPDEDDLDPVGTQEITISAWVNIPTFDSEIFGILGKIASAGSREPGNYCLTIWNNAYPDHVGKLRFAIAYNASNYQQVHSTSQVPTNEWVHVAFTLGAEDPSNKEARFYINGDYSPPMYDAPGAVIDQPFANTSRPLRIGHTGSFSDYFLGGIDEVRMYSRALSASEISELADTSCVDDECECTTAGSDGYTDLTLKFKTTDIVDMLVYELGDAEYGTAEADPLTLVFTLTGQLNDGTAIEGSDCMVLVGRVPEVLAARKADINEDGAVNFADLGLLKKYFWKSNLNED